MRIRKFCASRVEWRYIYQLLDSIKNENIRDYVANQIEWYVIKAGRYKVYEYTLKLLAVVMPTLVTVMQQYFKPDNLLEQAVILGGATITSASGVFLKLHDKRVLYRKAAEQIKDETMLYINHATPYSADEHNDCSERDERFVAKLKEISNCTNNIWGKIEDDKRSDAGKVS